MSSFYAPRYSVCMPGTPPTEVYSTNDVVAAFQRSSEVVGSVVYDWSINKRIFRPLPAAVLAAAQRGVDRYNESLSA